MDYLRRFKNFIKQNAPNDPIKSKGGVALFMVIASMTMLSILVTEFIYTAQVNQRLAFDGLDQVQALYLAKSGFKISLLRLKAYQQVKAAMGGQGGAQSGAQALIPQSVLDQIWAFPFMFPIPADIPGLTGSQKDEIKKFTDESNLGGSFTAVIESESSKYNLNSMLASFAASPTPDPSASPSPSAVPSPDPSASPGFSPEAAREALQDYISKIILQKFENDEEFAADYRDLKVEELTDKIFAWADRTYTPKFPQGKDALKYKQAPFYTLSELHMIEGMDDTLYNLLSPNLTVSTTPGINVNTMKEETLKALVSKITKDEVTEFFKFRDKEDADNHFKKAEEFFTYLKANVASFGANDTEINNYKADLQKKNIYIVTDETNFKITVQSKVNKVTRILEAWVTLKEPAKTPAGAGPNPQGSLTPNQTSQSTQTTDSSESNTGLKVTFMRIL